MKILIVDDDPRLRDLLRIAVERAGFTAATVADGQAALVAARRDAPDLMVLDIGLPEMDGFEVCRRLRATSDLPILFLTARDDEVDRIVGLELGADDYVTKPFSPREVVARIRAILKRSSGAGQAQTQRHGPIVLDRAAAACNIAGQPLALTATEFRLLDHLLSHPGRLWPKPRLIDAIWGAGSQVSDRTFDSHLRNLRQKLTVAGLPDAIETLHGQGLRLGAVE